VRRLKTCQEHGGRPETFLDALSLERGIDHSGLGDCGACVHAAKGLSGR
jgi:hypothetical protein